jgi:hypothetical protein
MTAVAFAMSDFSNVRVPEDRGGCGEEHHAETDDRGRKVVQCDQCAPYLVASVYGFASTAVDVPLTPDERAAQAAAESDARMSQAGLLTTLAGRMAPQRSLADEVSAMSDEQRAEFRKLLAPGKTR